MTKILRYAAQFEVDPSDVFDQHPIGASFQTPTQTVRHAALLLGMSSVYRVIGNHRDATNSWKFFAIVSETDQVDYIVDLSKKSGRGKALYLERPRHTTIIHLVRDGRGVAKSFQKHYKKSFKQGLTNWVSTNRKINWMLKTVHPDRKMLIRYED